MLTSVIATLNTPENQQGIFGKNERKMVND